MSDLWVLAITTILGSGVGTASVGAMFKRRFDRELELQRAVLERGTRIHERQVDALLKLDQHLRSAHAFLGLMSKSVMFHGEDPSGYPIRFRQETLKAYEQLESSRLLLPPKLVPKVEDLFRRMVEGEAAVMFFRDPQTPDGPDRAAHWERAKTVAHQELPELIRAIEHEARTVIHGPEAAG
jgi:hypothetical protein